MMLCLLAFSADRRIVFLNSVRELRKQQKYPVNPAVPREIYGSNSEAYFTGKIRAKKQKLQPSWAKIVKYGLFSVLVVPNSCPNHINCQ